MSRLPPDFVPVSDASVTAPRGFRAGAASARVKEGTARPDVALVVSDTPCAAHALFTRSRVVAAPVIVSRERILDGRAQGIVLNAGNANACTGVEGLAAARTMADDAAERVGVDPDLILVASTGVIGMPLPIDRIQQAIRQIQPAVEGGHAAARAIMTTDLVSKEAAWETQIGGRTVRVAGMAKGSGMIHPNLATLLAVVTTDATLDPSLVRMALRRAADTSFNQVSIDRDTSTNDTLALFANGAAAGAPIRPATAEARIFQALLDALCIDLARKIARDGEGATRLIDVEVVGAATTRDARRIAREISASSLVKSAIYGRDPNWGRIMMAVGNAGVAVDPERIDVFIGDAQVARQGAYIPYDRKAVVGAMGAEEVKIRLDLNQGTARGLAWGCDLTEEYVKINAEYTT